MNRYPTTAFLLTLKVMTLARAYDVQGGEVEYPFSGDAIALLTGRDRNQGTGSPC